MVKTLLFVLAAITLACAQPPRPRPKCSRPPSGWMGYFREANYDAQPGEIAYRFGEMNYDAINQRIKINEYEEREGERPEKILKLTFYQQKIEYCVERDVCTKRTITEPFDPSAVLPNSTFYGSDYLGATISGLGVYVDHFGQEMQSGGRYYGTFAPISSSVTVVQECVPILESFINLRGPYSERMNVQYEFLNITVIATWPPGAFDIPTSCIN